MKLSNIILSLSLINSTVAFSPSATSRCASTPTQLHSSNDVDVDVSDRRRALATMAGLFTTAIISTQSAPPANAAQGLPLFKKVESLETANYIGQVGKPVYKPNSNGAPEKHIPQVTVNGQDVEISANHIMSEEHYIKFIWLKDAKTNEVVLAKELAPTEETPILKAKVPSGVTLRPYLFCNLHGLWKGEEFTVA